MKVANVISLIIVAILIGATIMVGIQDAVSNEKGILIDYTFRQYETEPTSYLTLTVFNPEIGKHRTRTVRIIASEPPNLDSYIGTWIKVNIKSNGLYLDSITTTQGVIYKRE